MHFSGIEWSGTWSVLAFAQLHVSWLPTHNPQARLILQEWAKCPERWQLKHLGGEHMNLVVGWSCPWNDTCLAMHSFAAARSVKCRTMELCVLQLSRSGERTRNLACCNIEGCGIISELASSRAWMSWLSWDVLKEVGMPCIRIGYVLCTNVRSSESFGSHL